jgi:hypothetical protein
MTGRVRGRNPALAGSRPPSDTTETRLLQANLLVADVQRRRSVHVYVEVVR